MSHMIPLHHNTRRDLTPEQRAAEAADHANTMLGLAKGMNGFRQPGKSLEPTLVEGRAVAAGLLESPAVEAANAASARKIAAAASRKRYREDHPNVRDGWSNWQRHHGGAPYPFQNPEAYAETLAPAGSV